MMKVHHLSCNQADNGRAPEMVLQERLGNVVAFKCPKCGHIVRITLKLPVKP